MGMRNISVVKEEIRKEILQKRKSLTNSEYHDKCRRINTRLCGLPHYISAGVIHLYISSLSGEVDTFPILHDVWKRSKRVVVPCCRLNDRRLIHSELHSTDKLVKNPVGIFEPVPDYERPVDSSVCDLVIVPGLAFDRLGGRIGFGGGYYDRFLTNVTAPTIALAFAFQIYDTVPLQDHDQRVNLIVTEDELIECKFKNT